MTNQQILKKAIKKAIKNGWKNPFNKNIFKQAELFFGWNALIYLIIFSHDFAKAFWGEGLITRKCKKCGHKGKSHCLYQYYLQQMVLEKEPLKYLEKFL